MFLVGGGIFVHNVDFIHHLLADYQLADGLLGNVATVSRGCDRRRDCLCDCITRDEIIW